MELPIFELKISEDINDDAEVNFVSMVDRPAVQRNWNAFKDVSKFKIANEERRIVSGVIMLADTPIFRSDAIHGDYYVVFTADTIYKIVQRYFKKGFQNNVNINHDQNLLSLDTTVFETFISDSSRGILPMKGFEDTPEGSWFGSMYIESDETWERVKSKEINGFSVEGIFEYSKKPSAVKNLLDEIKNILAQVK
jgi:hypothetical protein